MRRPVGAVAVDAGASRVRSWAGWLEEGRLHAVPIAEWSHAPVGRHWDFAGLTRFAADACAAARARFDSASIGFDTWGVDFGVVTPDGSLLAPPVSYRDSAHQAVFERFDDGFRGWLWQRTGVQHQPFNTFYQLIARGEEDPALQRGRFVLLPDLLLASLGAPVGREVTGASTTQLLGANGWPDPEVWAMTGWDDPAPPLGSVGDSVGTARGVTLVRVAGHDTASAVVGLGTLAPGDAFLSMGTWSLVGTVVDRPVLSRTAEEGRWSNERTPDGRVRFLRNVPGSWVLDRLHAELGIPVPLAEWLAAATPDPARFRLLDRSLLDPPSMTAACAKLTDRPPETRVAWGAAARESLVAALADSVAELGSVTGVPVRRIRACGGGSRLAPVLQRLADVVGVPIVAGPVEATVAGNLGLQFVARGHVTARDLPDVLDRSFPRVTFSPGGPK